jgi:hypothetical protein
MQGTFVVWAQFDAEPEILRRLTAETPKEAAQAFLIQVLDEQTRAGCVRLPRCVIVTDPSGKEWRYPFATDSPPVEEVPMPEPDIKGPFARAWRGTVNLPATCVAAWILERPQRSPVLVALAAERRPPARIGRVPDRRGHRAGRHARVGDRGTPSGTPCRAPGMGPCGRQAPIPAPARRRRAVPRLQRPASNRPRARGVARRDHQRALTRSGLSPGLGQHDCRDGPAAAGRELAALAGAGA